MVLSLIKTLLLDIIKASFFQKEFMEEMVSVELPKNIVKEFRDGCHADPGNHQWEVIYRTGGAFDTDHVVRWCPLCGSVVIDVETDNRVQPWRVMKIRSPLIANEMSYKGS